MRTRCSFVLIISLVSGVLVPGVSWAQPEAESQPDIYSGYYSREGNSGKMAKSSGHSHYVRFYPENRIARLYIPFPFSRTIKSDAINTAFSVAVKKTSGSAYIRDKFGVMEESVVAHLDFFRWLDGKAVFDCGNAAPCEITFNDDSMVVIKPGIVLDHKIVYELVKDR